MLDGALIDDLDEAESLYAEWDALAVANGLPTMAPAWVLSWWEHFAPARAAPRIVAVRDGPRLVGLAPFFVEPRAGGRVDYRLPGIELAARLAPLAARGREWAVAETTAAILSRADPRPDVIALEGLPVASHWVPALRETWPGALRPSSRWYAVHRCLTSSLGGGSLDGWLAGRSRHFREAARRARRRFEQAGGSHRISTPDTLEADVATLLRLHAARWEHLGASNLAGRVEDSRALLSHAGRRLEVERFRLMMLEIDGAPIGAYLSVSAGREMLGVNGGWDERFARMSPFLVHVMYLIEDAIDRGIDRIDLGLGDQFHKRRVADGDDPVGWAILLPPGSRMALTALRVAPMLGRYAARDVAKRALSEHHIDQLRAVRSRWRSSVAAR